MPTHKLTAEILNAAILGFEEQKRRIDTQIAELRQTLHGGPMATAATPAVPRGKRRKMSAAARKRIGDAQRKRWAESKKESAPSSPGRAQVEAKTEQGWQGRNRRSLEEKVGGETGGGEGPAVTRQESCQESCQESAGEGFTEGREEGCRQATAENRRDSSTGHVSGGDRVDAVAPQA
jgi:hypothetical protein